MEYNSLCKTEGWFYKYIYYFKKFILSFDVEQGPKLGLDIWA